MTEDPTIPTSLLEYFFASVFYEFSEPEEATEFLMEQNPAGA